MPTQTRSQNTHTGKENTHTGTENTIQARTKSIVYNIIILRVYG